MHNDPNILIGYPYRIFFNESGNKAVFVKGYERIQENSRTRYKQIATICEIR